MANTAQARKRARQANRNRERNMAQRSFMRTTVKNVLKAVEASDKTAATAALPVALSNLDKASGKGLLHKNKAARIKARLVRETKAL